MSICQAHLCSALLKDEFGDVVMRVCVFLLRKGTAPSGIIAQQEALKLSEVRKALRILIQHGVVSYECNKRGFVEYASDLDNILRRCRFPHYTYITKTLYGDAAELIVEDILRNGQMELCAVVMKVTEQLKELECGTSGQMSVYDVRDKFENLTQTHFLQRCPELQENLSDKTGPQMVPKFTTNEDQLYVVPQLNITGTGASKKRKKSTEDSGPPQKKIKTESDQASDAGIYWKVNFDRFDQHLRDQVIIEAVTRKIDVRAGEILRTLLRLSETNTESSSDVTNMVSFHEIFQGLPEELGLSRQTLEQYLRILVEDTEMNFLHKSGESGGGMYLINFKKTFSTLCKSHLESVIQERFGSKSLRIFRLLILKKQLEQKQIEEAAMVPAKETKELLYTLFGEHFVDLTEVPKTPDHAPSRTFFLFSVNVNQVARMVLEHSYKALHNLILRRNQETTENKRLLEKQQRMEAIISSLEPTDADSNQKQEIEEMITPAEKALIAKVKGYTKKLESAELQLDETIFVLKTYLKYSSIK